MLHQIFCHTLDKRQELSNCPDPSCQVCQPCLAYMAGYLVYSMSKRIKFADCIDSLHHSDDDRCPAISLILMKSYNPQLVDDYHKDKGLEIPGSVLFIIMKAETILRKNTYALSLRNLFEVITHDVLDSPKDCYFFPNQKIPDHSSTLARELTQRHIKIRVWKVLKELRRDPGQGNFLH